MRSPNERTQIIGYTKRLLCQNDVRKFACKLNLDFKAETKLKDLDKRYFTIFVKKV